MLTLARNSRIAEYESRVRRLESLLEERSAAQPLAQEQPFPPADQSIPLSTYVGSLREEVNSWPIEEGPHLGPPAFDRDFRFLDESLNAPLNEDFDLNPAIDQTNPNLTATAVDPIEEFHGQQNFLQDLSLQPTIPIS